MTPLSSKSLPSSTERSRSGLRKVGGSRPREGGSRRLDPAQWETVEPTDKRLEIQGLTTSKPELWRPVLTFVPKYCQAVHTNCALDEYNFIYIYIYIYIYIQMLYKHTFEPLNGKIGNGKMEKTIKKV